MKELSPYAAEPTTLRAHRPAPTTILPFSAEEEEGLDLRECWRAICKHRELIAATVASVVVLTALVVFTMTPSYTAKSTVLIEPSAPQVLDIKELMSEAPGPDQHDYYKTQYDILRSRTLAAEVIRTLDLEDNPLLTGEEKDQGFVGGLSGHFSAWAAQLFTQENTQSADVDGIKPEFIDAYLKRLEIEPRLDTRLVVVAFTTPDPSLSARVANAHVQAYIQQGIKLHMEASSAARQFLEKELVELKQRVEKSEAALNGYRRDRGIVTFSLHDKGTLIMQRLTELTTDLTKVQAERIALEAQHQLIGQGNYDSLPAVMSDPVAQQLKEQVAQLATQHASMSNRFNPGYNPLDDLKAKLDESRVRLNNEIRTVAESVESAYHAAVSRETKLEGEIAQVKNQAMALNDASVQDAVLAREVETNRQLYESVLKRMQQLSMAGQVTASNVSIVDTAQPPERPSSPKVLWDLAMSAFFGLAGVLGFIFVRKHFDDRFRNLDEAERYLRLPRLALVPDFAKLAQSRRKASRALARGADHDQKVEAKAVEAQPQGKEILVSPSHVSLAGEVYRTLHTALMFSRAGGPPKTILISSALADEGKTVTAVNTALAFALMGGKTVLVDADLRKGRCHEVLGIDKHLGLTEILAGQSAAGEIVQPTSASQLYLLSSGSVPPNPGALLGSARMREVLTELGREYDFVLVDSPPLLLVNDAVVLSTMVDGVVLVIGQATPKQLVREARSRLTQVGATIFGVVLNQVDITTPGHYYYHHYYYYSRYQSRYYQKEQRA